MFFERHHTVSKASRQSLVHFQRPQYFYVCRDRTLQHSILISRLAITTMQCFGNSRPVDYPSKRNREKYKHTVNKNACITPLKQQLQKNILWFMEFGAIIQQCFTIIKIGSMDSQTFKHTVNCSPENIPKISCSMWNILFGQLRNNLSL